MQKSALEDAVGLKPRTLHLLVDIKCVWCQYQMASCMDLNVVSVRLKDIKLTYSRNNAKARTSPNLKFQYACKHSAHIRFDVFSLISEKVIADGRLIADCFSNTLMKDSHVVPHSPSLRLCWFGFCAVNPFFKAVHNVNIVRFHSC